MRSYISRLQRLEITVPRFGYGDDERFARIVHQAWCMFPLRDRRLLKKYGRQIQAAKRRYTGYGPGVPDIHPHVLRFELFWAGRAGEYGTIGEAAIAEATVSILAAAFSLMPDNLAVTLIVHELTHILRVANGQAGEDKDWEEELTRMYVDEIMGCFEDSLEDSLTDWIKANIEAIERAT